MATNNTVEYRATLDPSGIKTGAAQANQALNSIGAGGLKPAAAGLESAAQTAKGLARTAASTAQTVGSIGEAGAQAGAQTARGMEQATAGASKLKTQAAAAGQAVNSISTQAARQELNEYGMTAGQMSQAMRMLPMQVTDFSVSVASGMPIYMAAIQQGGQLKDSFNGVGNALKATTGFVLGSIGPLSILAAGAAAVALAYYQGSKEMDGYNKAVILSGGAAGVTALQLSAMAREVDAVTGTQATAAPVLAEMARSGKIAGESLAEFTIMAQRMESVGGKAISTTIQELEELGKKPVEASLKLQEQYNYLTPAVFRQIKALEAQGKSEEAAALAQKTYADAMSTRAKQLDSELGYIERGWRAVKNMAAEAWDAMANVGRPTTITDKAQKQIDALEAEIKRNKEKNERLGIKDGQYTRDLELQLENAKGLQQAVASVDKATGDALARANKQRQTGIDLEQDLAKYATKQLQKEQELAAAKGKYVGYIKELRDSGEYKEAKKAQEAYDQLVAGINDRYKSAGGSKGGIKVSDNELANLQGQLQAAKAYYDQLVTLGAGAAGLNSAERESLVIGEQIKRTTDEKVIAKLKEKQAIADTLGVQLRTNSGLEESYQAHQKAIDANFQEAEALKQKAQDQEAANEVMGKGRTAIQEMTLATMQHQLQEAEGSNSFDPAYIAGLKEKIKWQEAWTNSLKNADLKAINAHTDELLRSAQALGATYEDELSLSGKTGLERAKIAALRQVELKYARELARVDNSNLPDADKEFQRGKVLEAQQIESAAAVSRATTQFMAETSDSINRGLTDALMNGFKSGEGFAKGFGKSVKDMFNSMVLRPTLSFILQPFAAQLNAMIQSALGGLSIGGGGAAGGGSGLMGSLGSGGLTNWSGLGASAADWMWNNGISMVNNGFTSVGGAMMDFSSTIAGVDNWFKGIPGFSGGLGSAFGYLGSIISLAQGNYGSAIGSAIGTFILPGIGTMIGSVLGNLVGGLFGRKLKESGIEGEFGGESGFEGRLYKFYKGGLFRSNKTKYEDMPEEMRKGLGDQFLAMDDSIRSMAGMLGLGSSALDGFTAKIKVDLKGLSDEEATKKLQEEFLKVAEQMAGLVLTTDEYSRSGETQLETLTRLSVSLTSVNQLFDVLGLTMLDASLASADWASQLIEAAGGADKLGQAVNKYYDLYYSDEEKRSNAVRMVDKGMEEKGLDLRAGDVDAKQKYRALVEKAVADKDEELLAWLLEFADDFAAGADAAAESVEKATNAVADKMKQAQEELEQARSETMNTLGLSMDSLTKGFIQEINEGRGSSAGSWLADQIASGFEQSVYERGVNAILTTMVDGMITPMVTAMVTGSAVTDAVSAAAIDNMIANANAALAVLNSILNSAEFKEGLKKLQITVKDLGNTAGSQIKPMTTYRSSVASTGRAADSASAKLNSAADEAKRLADEWKRLIETMTDSVKELRGEAAGNGQEGLSYWRAQLAIDTAAAKAGDQEAAGRLNEIVKKLSTLEAANAASSLENQRAQAQLAQSLEDTARYLAQKYQISIPGFASGGTHAGGLRIVGENGPELEMTGPSRILSNDHLGDLFASRESSDEGQGLSRAVGRMHVDMLASQRSTNKLLLEMLRLFESWDRRGMPAERAVMTTA